MKRKKERKKNAIYVYMERKNAEKDRARKERERKEKKERQRVKRIRKKEIEANRNIVKKKKRER